MILPKEVHILGITYDVEAMNLDGDDGAYYGKVWHLDPTIYIEETLRDDIAIQSVIHETIHALFHQTGHIDIDDEERVACLLGCQLPQLLRDNREFFLKILGEA